MSYKVMVDPRDNMLDFKIYDTSKCKTTDWASTMEVTELSYKELFCYDFTCPESSFFSLCEDYLESGKFSLVEFETFEECIDYLNDLIFLHELKK